MKGIKIALAALVAVCVSYVVIGEAIVAFGGFVAEDWCESYNEGWERVFPDGRREGLTIPGSYDNIAQGEEVLLENVLPAEISDGTCICFRSAKQDMQILIDGQLRKEYSTKDIRIFGTASAVAFVFVPLSPMDAGKTITWISTTNTSYSGTFYGILLGSQMGIWGEHFNIYALELVVAMVTIIFGAIGIIISLVLSIAYKREINLEYLGLGIIMGAVWLIFNSAFRQLLFTNIAMVNDMAFIMLMVLPLPFLIYMNGIQKGRYEKVYSVVGMLAVLNIIVCFVLHASRVADFADTVVVQVLVCIIAILTMVAMIIIDLIKGNFKEYLLLVIGLTCAFVAAVVQIFIYFHRIITFTGSIIAIGLSLLLIFATANSIKELIEGEREKRRAILSNEAKGRFLADMSHEIRTPLNAVLGMNSMILRESSEREIRGYALKVQNAGEGLLSIVNDVLDISKIESGKMEIQPVNYDLSSLIFDVVNVIQIKAQKKNLDFYLKVDETLPSTLYGDDIRIKQTLINLLNNAVKYTQEGSVTLNVTGERKGDEVALSFHVLDTGIGIKEEDIGKIFVEYERFEEVKNRNVEGTGLGMSITMRLLKLMDSELEIKSVYGEGSDFSFTLKQKIIKDTPVGNFEENVMNMAKEYSYQVAFTAPEAQILVVDDNAINREVFLKLLKDTEMQIEDAEDGLSCLRMMKKKHYDMVFLDHMMPDMDGIEVMREIQKLREDKRFPCQDTRVIALTANVIAGVKEQYLEEGFYHYLSKPIRYDELEHFLLEELPEELVHKTKISKMEPALPKESEEEMEFPIVEGVDWDVALLKLHKKSILKDTVLQFIQTGMHEAQGLEELYERLKDADGEAEKKEMASFRVKVHSMKSSALMIGAVAVGGVALSLEISARKEEKEEILRVTPTFLKMWKDLVVTLKELFQPVEKDNSIHKSIDKEAIRRLLDSLIEAIKEMDVDTADVIMAQLKEYDYPKEMESCLQEMDSAVMNLDEDVVVRNCEEMIKMVIDN